MSAYDQRLPDEIVLRIKWPAPRIERAGSYRLIDTYLAYSNFLCDLLARIDWLAGFDRQEAASKPEPFRAMTLEDADRWDAACAAVQTARDEIEAEMRRIQAAQKEETANAVYRAGFPERMARWGAGNDCY